MKNWVTTYPTKDHLNHINDKKTLEYYQNLPYSMTLIYFPEEKSGDNAWVIRFPDLPGCIMHGETPEEALRKGLEVKNEWLKAALEEGWEMPEPST